MTFLSIAFMGDPVTMWVALLGFVGLGFLGGVGDAVSSIGSSIGDTVGGAVDAIGSAGDVVGDIADEGFEQLASASGQIGFDAGEDAFNTTGDFADDATGVVGDFVTGNIPGAVEEVGNLGAEVTDQFASGADQVGLGGVSDTLEDVSDFGENPISTGFEQLASLSGQVGIGGGVEDALNSASDYGSALESIAAGDYSAGIAKATEEVIRDTTSTRNRPNRMGKKAVIKRGKELIKQEGSISGAINAAENPAVRKVLQRFKQKVEASRQTENQVADGIEREDRSDDSGTVGTGASGRFPSESEGSEPRRSNSNNTVLIAAALVVLAFMFK
jgi:hypothetical protein